VGARLVGHFHAAQHACEFLDARVAVERDDLGAGRPPVCELADPQVVMALRGDLRQVGDAQHLAAIAQRAQFRADDLGDRPTDAGIHFVEHHAATLAATARDLHGERQACEFAA